MTSPVMPTLTAILLLFGVSCALVEEELAVCKREEMDQAFNMSCYPWEDTQMRSTVRNVMLHLDLLSNNPEEMERQFVLKLSREDLLELQKYVKGESAVVDVESILIQSLEMEKLRMEKPSTSPEPSGLPQFHPDVDHFSESFVIIFQV